MAKIMSARLCTASTCLTVPGGIQWYSASLCCLHHYQSHTNTLYTLAIWVHSQLHILHTIWAYSQTLILYTIYLDFFSVTNFIYYKSKLQSTHFTRKFFGTHTTIHYPRILPITHWNSLPNSLSGYSLKYLLFTLIDVLSKHEWSHTYQCIILKFNIFYFFLFLMLVISIK